jgi:hypothetical protein
MLHFLTEFLNAILATFFSNVICVLFYAALPVSAQKLYLLINKKPSRKKLVDVAKILAM